MANEDTLAMLQDSLARYLEDCHGFEARLAALREAETAPPPFWQGLARELDLLRAAWPEEQGGLGLGLAAHLAVMETLGAALAAQPYLATMVLGAGLLQRHPGAAADALLAQVGQGRAVLAFAHGEPDSRHSRHQVRTQLQREGEGWRLDGRKAVVHAGPWASHFIVSARSAGAADAPDAAEGLSLLLVPRDTPGLSLRAYPLRDGDR
ncbi:MAG TPA: acyl-CoA dehydrogenase family protein, partial [Pseudorhodoferax sp.]|nr:acyl-CoA dehydrogenase family protein [Pseudorhodoferax sp.]